MRLQGRTERLWVWRLLVVSVLIAEIPGALHKCIFDDVQAQIRVVRAAPIQPHHQHKLKALNGNKRLQSSRQQARLPGVALRRRSILEESVMPTSTVPQPIRIKTWTPLGSDNLSEAERGRVEAAVEEALRVTSSMLSVNRAAGPLLLSRDINKYCKFLWKNSTTINYNRCGRANSNYRTETCLDVTIPDDHLAGCHIYPEADSSRRTVLRTEGAGLPDTDFLLYLHMQTTDKCRAELNVLAYTAHCQTGAHGRPVAGVVVICTDRLKGAAYSHQTAVQTVIHELFHALGFSKELFTTWRDCLSSSEDARCSPRGKATHSDGSGQMRIYTPSVISALQKHLESTDPELGGPLENLDASADRLSSHWESRVLRGSIMTAVLEDPTTVWIDPVTLAALQDTGWYTVNLSLAQSLVWGGGEGSTFGSLSTCQDNSSSFFCSGSYYPAAFRCILLSNTPESNKWLVTYRASAELIYMNGLGCHFLHLHKGECQTDQYLEGCRIYKLLKNGSECWKEENSRWSSGENWSGEIYGFDSRCFFSSLIRQEHFVQASSSVEGRCYRQRCTGLNRYQIQVFDSEWVDCPAGDTVQIEGYQGSVFCPDRRLCWYPDVTPPSEAGNSLHPCITCDPLQSLTSTEDGSSPLRPPVAAALCFTAAGCFLTALLVSYRKWRKTLSRIHTVAPENQEL